MSKRYGRGLLRFCAIFLVFVSVLVMLWWCFALPAYGRLLGQATGLILKYAVGVPVDAVRVVPDPKAVFNTETNVDFFVGGHWRSIDIGKLATNLPTYWALVLATAGLAFWKRLRILFYGTFILCAVHAAFIVIIMRFQEQIKGSEIPVAVVQFFLTLPFLLWIAFAYWDKITAAGGAAKPGPCKDAPADSEHTGEEKES